MNRVHNRKNNTGEEMDLSHLVDSGNNQSNTLSVASSNTPNNQSNRLSNSGSSVLNKNSNNTSHSSGSDVSSNNNDPLVQFLSDPDKISRNKKEEENKAEKERKNRNTPQKPIPRSNVPEVEGKVTAFVPFVKGGKVSFHSFSIQTKTATNMDIEHITPPYANQSNKKNNAQ